MSSGLLITFVTPSGTGSNTLRWSSLGIWECRGSRRYLLLMPERTEKLQHQWKQMKKENKLSLTLGDQNKSFSYKVYILSAAGNVQNMSGFIY